MPGGHETTYTKEMGDKICRLVASCHKPLSKIVRENDELPHLSTVYKWRDDIPEFSEKLKAAQANNALNAMVEADDFMDERLHYYTDDKGNQRIDSPSATITMAKHNTKKWLLTKLCPEVFGDKPQQDNGASSLIVEALKDKLNQSKK